MGYLKSRTRNIQSRQHVTGTAYQALATPPSPRTPCAGVQEARASRVRGAHAAQGLGVDSLALVLASVGAEPGRFCAGVVRGNLNCGVA